MAHLLKLGPVQLSGTTTHVYLKISDAGDVAQPVFQPDDVAGLRELIGSDDPQAHAAAPDLAVAAEALGIPVAAAPLEARRSASAIAVFMAWGQKGLSGLGSDLALKLIHACTDLWKARPWLYWRDDQPIAVTVTGAAEATFEGSVFGSSSEGYGLALYEERGALKRLHQLQAEGRHEDARRLPAVGLLLDDKPEYAAKALERAELVPKVPIPIRSGPSGPSLPRPEESLVLIAALHAVSQLSASVREATAEAEFNGAQLFVRVVAPPATLKN